MARNTIPVDVREDIRAGREPFSKIMNAVAALQPDEQILLLAPFEPEPLYHVLMKHGFRHRTQRMVEGHYEVLLTRDLAPEPKISGREQVLTAVESPCEPTDEIQKPIANEIFSVDARGLEPPQPLVAILEALGTLPTGAELRAQTDRRPMHLYPQLEARGFTGESQEQPDGSFITHIRRR